jgi:hypothetical protein
MDIRYITVSDQNYFHHVATLFHSLQLQGKTELFWGHIDQDAIHLKRITSTGIEMVQSNIAMRRNSDGVVEASTRFRPALLLAMFDACGCEAGVYIDPDIFVYESLDELFTGAATAWIVPHLLASDFEIAENDDRFSELYNQAHSLQRWGAYNMGVYCVRNSENGRRFLSLYQSFLSRDCSLQSLYSFVDQKWMDVLASIFNDEVDVLAHPGVNLSYWNIVFRDLTETDGNFFVNGVSLKAFHFSGVNAKKVNCDYGRSNCVQKLIKEYQAFLLKSHKNFVFQPTGSSSNKAVRTYSKYFRNILFYILNKTESRQK